MQNALLLFLLLLCTTNYCVAYYIESNVFKFLSELVRGKDCPRYGPFNNATKLPDFNIATAEAYYFGYQGKFLPAIDISFNVSTTLGVPTTMPTFVPMDMTRMSNLSIVYQSSSSNGITRDVTLYKNANGYKITGNTVSLRNVRAIGQVGVSVVTFVVSFDYVINTTARIPVCFQSTVDVDLENSILQTELQIGVYCIILAVTQLLRMILRCVCGQRKEHDTSTYEPQSEMEAKLFAESVQSHVAIKPAPLSLGKRLLMCALPILPVHKQLGERACMALFFQQTVLICCFLWFVALGIPTLIIDTSFTEIFASEWGHFSMANAQFSDSTDPNGLRYIHFGGLFGIFVLLALAVTIITIVQCIQQKNSKSPVAVHISGVEKEMIDDNILYAQLCDKYGSNIILNCQIAEDLTSTHAIITKKDAIAKQYRTTVKYQPANKAAISHLVEQYNEMDKQHRAAITGSGHAFISVDSMNNARKIIKEIKSVNAKFSASIAKDASDYNWKVLSYSKFKQFLSAAIPMVIALVVLIGLVVGCYFLTEYLYSDTESTSLLTTGSRSLFPIILTIALTIYTLGILPFISFVSKSLSLSISMIYTIAYTVASTQVLLIVLSTFADFNLDELGKNSDEYEFSLYLTMQMNRLTLEFINFFVAVALFSRIKDNIVAFVVNGIGAVIRFAKYRTPIWHMFPKQLFSANAIYEQWVAYLLIMIYVGPYSPMVFLCGVLYFALAHVLDKYNALFELKTKPNSAPQHEVTTTALCVIIVVMCNLIIMMIILFRFLVLTELSAAIISFAILAIVAICMSVYGVYTLGAYCSCWSCAYPRKTQDVLFSIPYKSAAAVTTPASTVEMK